MKEGDLVWTMERWTVADEQTVRQARAEYRPYWWHVRSVDDGEGFVVLVRGVERKDCRPEEVFPTREAALASRVAS
jgi:hypothetical protein